MISSGVKSLSVKKSVTVTVGGKVTIKPTVKAPKKTSTAVKVKVKNKNNKLVSLAVFGGRFEPFYLYAPK